MADDSNGWNAVWLVSIPSWMVAIAIWLIFYFSIRKRSWSDRGRLGKALAMPPELLEGEPEKVRNMILGQAAWIDRSYVAVDKKGRTWIDWTASFSHETPVGDWGRERNVHLQRLERGFSITVHQKHQFRQRPSLLWGYYAPVVEIVQEVVSASNRDQADLTAVGISLSLRECSAYRSRRHSFNLTMKQGESCPVSSSV